MSDFMARRVTSAFVVCAALQLETYNGRLQGLQLYDPLEQVI